MRIKLLADYSDAEFHEFCVLNADLDIERTAHGELLIMAPAGFDTSHLNSGIIGQLDRWSRHDGTGRATDSSGGYILPNSAVRAPDAAWIRNDRLAAIPAEERRRFLPLCPDFAIELLSATDSLPTAQEKMREYVDNGLRLGWLIDPFARRVHVYRPDAEVVMLDDPPEMDGAPVLPGFRLVLRDLW